MKWNKKKFAIKREQRQACSSLPSVNKLCKTAWAVTVGIILCGCLLFWPTSERACREGVAEAVTVSWYELGVPGGDTLYFNVLRTDSTLRGLSTECETAQREFRANAFFISYSGRLLTAADSVTRPKRLNRETLLPALQKESRLVSVRLAGFRRMLEEMEYYGRTHSVVDEGFHEVMAHNEWVKAQCGELARCKQALDRLLAVGGEDAYLREERMLRIHAGAGRGADEVSVACRRLAQRPGGPSVWQVAGGKLPDGCRRFRLNPFPYGWFHILSPYYTWWGHWGWPGAASRRQEAEASPVSIRMKDGCPEIPLIQGAEGAPVFGPWRNLNGMWVGDRFYPSAGLYALSLSHASWPECVWEDLKAWVSGWRTGLRFDFTGEKDVSETGPVYGTYTRRDTLFYGQLAGGFPEGEGVMRYPDGGVYRGSWHAGIRKGYGEYTDSLGRTYSGYWRGDSLRRGRLRAKEGTYEGLFNRRMEEHGEGEFTANDGGYYVGKWKDGRRDGFGFSVAPHEVVKCGVWAKGRFRGEQMLYHSERIYGIDISKYQHVHKRRVYGIDWRNLRITRLGHTADRNALGAVDYPVSFVYIKSTEGLTVFNPYYTRDVRAARRYGFPVGAYHFFSTRPAMRQADYFLKKSRLQKGDLPPMLDVELSDRRIAAMGGRDVLFREMLVWLKEIGRRSGTMPIIYVSQDFVNRYMPFAPEALKAYPVWVARYGEYKPYVHLLYWQLSPDGRVRGIQGDVDIDVFNGSEEQFKRYLRTQTVK